MLRQYLLLFAIVSITSASTIDVLSDSVLTKEVFCRTKKINKPMKDVWFSQDKFLHFSACAALPGLTYHLYVCRLKRDENVGKIYSVSITALFGIGKEIYDKKKKGHFSWKDLFWSGLGLAVGYFVFVHDF